MTNAETFLNIFSGAQNKYGKCYKYIKETGEKLTIEETGLIPIELHLNGEKLLGRSPVNEKTKEVNWLAIDIDKKINPQPFCSKIWKELGWQYSTELEEGIKKTFNWIEQNKKEAFKR